MGELVLFINMFFGEMGVGGTEKKGVRVEDVVYVIGMVSVAVLVVGMLGVMRGFLEGEEMMGGRGV